MFPQPAGNPCVLHPAGGKRSGGKGRQVPPQERFSKPALAAAGQEPLQSGNVSLVSCCPTCPRALGKVYLNVPQTLER